MKNSPYLDKPIRSEDDIMRAKLKERARIARLHDAAEDLLTACVWAEAAISPFSKDPAEGSGISRLRAAIRKATE